MLLSFYGPVFTALKFRPRKKEGARKEEKGPVSETGALPLCFLLYYRPVLGFGFCAVAGVLPAPPCVPLFHCAVNTVSAMMPHTSPAL